MCCLCVLFLFIILGFKELDTIKSMYLRQYFIKEAERLPHNNIIEKNTSGLMNLNHKVDYMSEVESFQKEKSFIEI